jgi:hypothetical protein
MPLAALVFPLLACSDQRQPLGRPPSPFHIADSLRVLEYYQPALAHYRRLRDSFALARDTAGAAAHPARWAPFVLVGGMGL